MPLPIWQGSLQFGLVTIPVGLYPAETPDDLDLDLLDKRNMARVGYTKINKETGEQVPSEELVKGYAATDEVVHEQPVPRRLECETPEVERREAGAREARQRLADLGLESWPLSTGGKGLHVVVPLQRRRGWDEVKELAREIAAAMSSDAPELYLSKASKSARKGKIFVDWLRNGRGASAIVPFSTRAKPGATVATPLAWNEIARFRPGSSTVLTLPKRLARRSADPWQGFFSVRQTPPARRRAKR